MTIFAHLWGFVLCQRQQHIHLGHLSAHATHTHSDDGAAATVSAQHSKKGVGASHNTIVCMKDDPTQDIFSNISKRAHWMLLAMGFLLRHTHRQSSSHSIGRMQELITVQIKGGRYIYGLLFDNVMRPSIIARQCRWNGMRNALRLSRLMLTIELTPIGIVWENSGSHSSCGMWNVIGFVALPSIRLASDWLAGLLLLMYSSVILSNWHNHHPCDLHTTR